MKKTIITIVVVILVLALIALAACYFLGVFDNNYIGSSAAKAAALKDLGVTAGEVTGLKCDFEKEHDYAWYEVEFVHSSTEYDYSIDALTGEVKNVTSESVFD